MSPAEKKAWVVLLTNVSYLPSFISLERRMRQLGSLYPMIVMATYQLDETSRALITRRGIAIRDVMPLRPLGVHVLDEHDLRFEDTWTKLRIFSLEEYDRIVMMDADMILMRNIDELMTLELPHDGIAASHCCACNPRKLSHYPKDWIPENCAFTPLRAPDCLTNPTKVLPDSPRPYTQLNSGLVVLRPSLDLGRRIEEFLYTSPLVPSFAFPDQDLMAAFFKGRWRTLPYIYNGLKHLRFVHPNMWRDEDVKVVHFIIDKPWHPGGRRIGSVDEETHSWWWKYFDELEKEMAGPDGDREGLEWINKHVSRV